MVTTGALLTGLLLLTSGLLLVQTHAQETKATEKMPVTLDSLNKRLTALETENKVLKERIATLEKANTPQAPGWQIDGNPVVSDSNPQVYLYNYSNKATVLHPHHQLIYPPYQAPGTRLQTQPFVWDPQGRYDMLIQQKR